MAFHAFLRLLRRQPGFATLAVASLGSALAVVAWLALFVDAALLRPVAYRDANQLVDVLMTRGRGPNDRFGIRPADVRAWRDEGADALADLAAYLPFGGVDLGGTKPERVSAKRVTPGFFALLGAGLPAGRDFQGDDASARVAILGLELWRRLGGDPALVGSTLELDGQPYRVVGVAPGVGFRGGAADVWLPLDLAAVPEDAGALGVVARLRPGVSATAAEVRLAALSRALDPDPEAARPSVLPLTATITRRPRELARLLGVAAALVVALAVCSTANLLLARLAARERDLMIHGALGATSARLAGFAIGEGIGLGILGGALGLALATAAVDATPSLAGRLLFPSIALRPGATTAAAALLAGALAGALAALPAALRAAWTGLLSRPSLARRGAAAGPGDALVVVQLTLALPLLAVAASIALGLGGLLDRSLGFAPDRLAFEIALPATLEDDGEGILALAAAVSELDGVEVAGLASGPPGGGWGTAFSDAASDGSATAHARFLLVGPGWLEAAGLGVVAGRPPTTSDGARPTAVLSEAAALEIAPDAAHALGRRVRWGDGDETAEVVAVVTEVRAHALADAEPTIYLSLPAFLPTLSRLGERRIELVVDADRSDAGLATRIAAEVGRLAPTLPVRPLGALGERSGEALFALRLATAFLLAIAAIATFQGLAGAGALLAFRVRRRAGEIGIRLALGATPADVQREVLRRAGGLALAGIALGAPLVWVAGLIAVHTLDGAARPGGLLTGVIAVTLAAAVVAAGVGPARRAARVDPATALRD